MNLNLKNLTFSKNQIVYFFKIIFSNICKIIRFSFMRIREFSNSDFALVKLCLLSFGLWIGTKFSDFLKKFRIIIFITFITSAIYILWRIFVCDDN